jgi:hypothetical protein
MISTKSRRDRDSKVMFCSPLFPGLVTLQAALCAAQCSFWHALLQYSTHLHALHLVRPPLGQPGHAERRSPAPDAPTLETEEEALVVEPLSAELAESVTGCGEIDMAEELVHGALELVALGAHGDQRRARGVAQGRGPLGPWLGTVRRLRPI